jgi:hypothetical protein
VLPLLCRHPLIDEVIVSHGQESTRFEDTSARADVVHRRDAALNARYGVALRFVAAREARNEAVLLVDDDLLLPRFTVSQLAVRHLAEPQRLHGLFGRRLDEQLRYRYGRVRRGPQPILLTRCVLMRRDYADMFLEHEERFHALATRSTPVWNGEDIVLSLLSIARGGQLPVAWRLPWLNTWFTRRTAISARVPPPGKLGHREHRKRLTAEVIEALDIEGVVRRAMAV